MFITTITIDIVMGKRKEARELIRKAAKIANEKCSDYVTVKVLQPRNGSFDRMIWVEEYASMAAKAEYLDSPESSSYSKQVKELIDGGYITRRVLNHYNTLDLTG